MSINGKVNRSEGKSSKPGADAARARRDAALNRQLATCSGMIVLLILITVTVVERSPDFPSDPTYATNYNAMHISQFYYAQARVLVRPFVIKALDEDSLHSADHKTGSTKAINSITYALPNGGAAAGPSTWSTLRWSRQFYDPDTLCQAIGDDIWYAAGTVEARSSSGVTAHVPWSMCFVGETSSVLFTKVGESVTGDLAQVRKLTQSRPAIPPNYQ